MELTSVEIKNFKKVRSAKLALGSINYLIGANNSGKSSILQAIHCAVTSAQSQIDNDGLQVLAEENLIYSPSSDFSLLGHNKPFENRSDGHRARIIFSGLSDAGDKVRYVVELYKGRNSRNVGIERFGRTVGFGSHISSSLKLFSVFVPGLAGIAHFEEFKTEAYVFRKIAGGEANLYLRNVLLILRSRNLLDEFVNLAREMFPQLLVRVRFDPKKDIHIDVRVRVERGQIEVPIDLVGTGVLQALQIFAYSTLTQPAILLLDEPDSHLHPSNQALLMHALEVVAEKFGTKVILATHSRHLINSAPDDAEFFWVDKGRIKDNNDFDLVKLLMEIGALDQSDNITGNSSPLVVVTEDTKTDALELLLRESTELDFGLIKLNGVANSSVAFSIIKQLITRVPGTPKFLFHRDRDFLTGDEVARWKEEFETERIRCFVTEGSDVESYFLDIEHIAQVADLPHEEVEAYILWLLNKYRKEIRRQFKNKRREINKAYNADGGAPNTNTLLGENEVPQIHHAVGKFLLRKIRGHSAERLGSDINPVCESEYELATDLCNLLTEMFEDG